jgi:hypothetical protein
MRTSLVPSPRYPCAPRGCMALGCPMVPRDPKVPKVHGPLGAHSLPEVHGLSGVTGPLAPEVSYGPPGPHVFGILQGSMDPPGSQRFYGLWSSLNPRDPLSKTGFWLDFSHCISWPQNDLPKMTWWFTSSNFIQFGWILTIAACPPPSPSFFYQALQLFFTLITSYSTHNIILWAKGWCPVILWYHSWYCLPSWPHMITIWATIAPHLWPKMAKSCWQICFA